MRLRRMIGGNTTNLNDFNNMKYAWVSDWYRQAMNNFWIPEEINLSQDVKDYPRLLSAERSAYDKILSFLVFWIPFRQRTCLISAPTLPPTRSISACPFRRFRSVSTHRATAICSTPSALLWSAMTSSTNGNGRASAAPQHLHWGLLQRVSGAEGRSHAAARDDGELYLEGIYFYSGFMFFYNLSRNGKMPGSAQEIRYINRDENTHLWLFRNIITELQKEQPELFTAESVQALREMMREGVEQEIAWGHYVIGDDIPGLNRQMISDYIRYLGNLRWTSLGYPALYPGFESEPESMEWVSQYADANMVKTDFFEARSTAYAKSTALIDDL